MKLDSRKYTGYYERPSDGPIDLILNVIFLGILAALGFLVANAMEVIL